MNCRIGRDSECSSKGCAFEIFGEVNCKNYIEPVLPIQVIKVKKVKIHNKPKPLAPINENDLKITEYVYNRSNGICYICGEPINKEDFRIYHSIVIKYSVKQIPILRAKHKKCKPNE